MGGDCVKGKILAVLSLFILIITSSTVAATKFVFEEQAAGYRYLKIETSILVLIIFVFSTFTWINTIQAAFETNSTYKEAKKYYQILAK